MTLEVFDLFGDYSYDQVGYRPQYGLCAQSQPLNIPAVIKHGELISRERCLLPAAENRATAAPRAAFSDMTRSMNAMPQPSLAQTSYLHPDCGGVAAVQCQPPRLARSLQVNMPSQPYVADELNTPVIAFNMDDYVSTTSEIDSQELVMGLSFPLNQGLNSQELLDTLFRPVNVNDPMLPVVGSQLDEGSRQKKLMLTFATMPIMDCINTPNCDIDTPDLIGDANFNLVTFVDGSGSEAKFDELAFENNQEHLVLKPEPDSPDSDDSGSGGMVMDEDQYAQSPDSTSPVFGRPAAGASAQYSNTDDTESEASSFIQKRPHPVGASGPSKRPHLEQDDDFQSMASSANELKVFESRRKNNQASKRSRSNKKSRDCYNENELQELEDRNNFLIRKTALLETVRDKMRALVTEKVRR